MIVLLLISIIFNFILWKKYTEDISLCNALSNEKAIIYTHLMGQNKYKVMKKMLVSDIVQLVHDYNKNTFERSRVLSSICNDWKSIVRPVVLNEIDSKKRTKQNFSYWETVKKNFYILDNNC